MLALVLVLALLAAGALIVWQVLSERSDYFQRRDLRTLGIVGTDISNLGSALSEVAQLHFDPEAMEFSLSPRTHCLVANATVPTSAGGSIKVSYYFVDPERSRLWLEKLAKTDDAGLTADAKTSPSQEANAATVVQQKTAGPGSSGVPAALPPMQALPIERCNLGLPLGTKAISSVELRSDSIVAEQTFRLSLLLWPMTATSATAQADDGTWKLGKAPSPVSSGSNELAALRARIIEAAKKDLEHDPLVGWSEAGRMNQLIEQSVATAFASNAIQMTATLSGAPISSHGLTDHFAAVKLYGPFANENGGPAKRKLLWSTGTVPPLVQSALPEGADRLLVNLLSGDTSPTAQGAPTSQGAKGLGEEVVPDASAARVGGLIIYQRDFVGLPGAGCTLSDPCKLVAVRDGKSFDARVREVDGVQATWLLISILTLISVLPLVQLALSKRLDPISRAGQYVLWLSLGLLTANAVVAITTLWSASAAYRQGETATSDFQRALNQQLGDEIDGAVTRFAEVAKKLNAQEVTVEPGGIVFPAPQDAALEDIPDNGFIAETVMLFEANGFPVRDRPRWNVLRAPSFGANIADRPYFQSASAGLFECSQSSPFLIDRVYSRPDGLPKTIIAMPRNSPLSSSVSDCAPARSGDPVLPPSATSERNASKASIVVATGYLRSLLTLIPPPGFSYAILGRPQANGPDVLFHSNPGSELVERFEDDTDRPEMLHEIVAHLGDGTVGQVVDTHYMARPVRLWLYPLTHGTGWTLVLIEDRNQAGYAIWREALFGYVAWSMAIMLVGCVALVFVALKPRALDRQPSMWLWPTSVLLDTTPGLRTKQLSDSLVGASRGAYNWHLILAVPVTAGILTTHGVARLLLALTLSAVIFAARGWFRGILSVEPKEGMVLDRAAASIGAVLLSASALSVLAQHLGRASDECDWLRHGITGAALVDAGLLLSWRSPWARERLFKICSDISASLNVSRAASWPWLHHIRGAAAAVHAFVRNLSAWPIAVVLAAAAPTLAGVLDAHQANRGWARSAERELNCDHERDSRTRIISINRSLVPNAALAFPKTKCGGTAATAETTWSSLVTRWTGFGHEAVAFAAASPHGWQRPSAATLFTMTLVVAALSFALWLFRKHFFSESPAGSGPVAVPSQDIRDAIHAIAVAATAGQSFQSPTFDHSPFNRHLIVGLGQDVLDDPTMWTSGVQEYDLTERGLEVDGATKCLVVTNFDAALLDKDLCQGALETLEGVLSDHCANAGLHVFLTTETEPLDRLVFTRERRSGEATTDGLHQGDERRWANHLRTMALYNVAKPASAAPALDPIAEELGAVEDLGAKALCTKLSGKNVVLNDETVAFIADALAEPYRLMWEMSTRDEKVILFYLAQNWHLKMRESFALRSLLLRRLVVRAPEYRLMNKSFARFVRSIGNPEELRSAALAVGDGADRIWPLLRVPLALLVVAGVAVLSVVVPNGTGAAAIIPALTAAFPALVTTWLKNKGAP